MKRGREKKGKRISTLVAIVISLTFRLFVIEIIVLVIFFFPTVTVLIDLDLWTELTLTMTSPSTGVINVSINESDPSHVGVTTRKYLYAPADNILLLSVGSIICTCIYTFEVYIHADNNSEVLLWRVTDLQHDHKGILEATNVIIQWTKLSRYNYCKSVCLTVYFSFHPKSNVPQRLSSGLYNCSVDDYWRFRPHVDCNLKVDCEDGRDEAGHCPFSSPACQGWVASRNRCYKYVSKETLEQVVNSDHSTFTKAATFCASLNASVGTFRTSKDCNAILKIFKFRIPFELKGGQGEVGLSYGSLNVPKMYRRSLVAYDKTVIHHSLAKKYKFYHTGTEIRFVLRFYQTRGLYYDLCSFTCQPQAQSYAFCEFVIPDTGQHHKDIALFSNALFSFSKGNTIFSRCPNGQVVHTFLSCHPHNACGDTFSNFCAVSGNLKNIEDSVPGIHQPVFSCDGGITRLPYSLVCDFKYECKDRSDETFCQHPPCYTFACSNGQCVSYSKRCDLTYDCLDESDEQMCEGYTKYRFSIRETKSPTLITFDGKHSFRVKRMSSHEVCPETHYRCPGEFNDCLPVYTRCNGWYDCIDHEDEEACETMACPGLYRCFNNTLCLHADHLCDDWPHCPQHDDEWLCDMTCPAQCVCLGHVFLCSKAFSAHLVSHLRFLDAQGSGMAPSDLHNNTYMVHLSLSRCALNYLPTMSFLNLQFLDLSVNNLTVVSITTFVNLVNLRYLSLAKNPIDSIHYDPNITVQFNTLRKVDLSFNKLTVFDSKAFSNMIRLRSLNLSFSTIYAIHPNGFQYTPKLTHLYLAGSPIDMFPADLFKALTSLQTLSSQTYKLCCREILPDHFEPFACTAPRNEISSCEDLLQSVTYRGFLWSISILSLLGNTFCLVFRVCVQKTEIASSFHVFVANLSTADLLMGVYIAIIGVADSRLRGKYLFFEETWKHSVACKVAGFLSLLSSEVSALTIWLITLDRFIVLRFPFSSVRFQRTSAAVACTVSWLVGLLLASTPLLPITSHWEFFSQTGICLPLPVTRQDFKGKIFSISIFIVLNFILFALIAMGQNFIYWSVQRNAFNTDSAKVSRDMTIARRLISVAVTDFLCWFPIGLCGLLALADIPISVEVNVALAIFVLPLNSALNPFMYTFNMLMEKRRKSRETKLLKWLDSNSDML